MMGERFYPSDCFIIETTRRILVKFDTWYLWTVWHWWQLNGTGLHLHYSVVTIVVNCSVIVTLSRTINKEVIKCLFCDWNKFIIRNNPLQYGVQWMSFQNLNFITNQRDTVIHGDHTECEVKLG